jgi:succinoglycan biosynthesis protein ExoA
MRSDRRTALLQDDGCIVVAVPALNEERFIEACLTSLVSQLPFGSTILVLDGGSTDRTVELVHRLQANHPQIELVHNPKRIQAAAINLAARIAPKRATILIRADAHAVYPPDFIATCVAAMRENRATSVVVPMKTVGKTTMQRAIAAAQSSLIGNGGSVHRTGRRSGFVDHGHHAAFDRAFFLRVGGYDESFTHNEDAEFDHRALANGGRIWMSADVPVVYFPRTTLGALARQYRNHGRGRARTFLKHKMRPKPRQLLPILALLGNCGAVALSVWHPATLVVPSLYAATCVMSALGTAVRHRDLALIASGAAAATMHHSWATGFLEELFTRFRRSPRPSTEPSRQTQVL